jgi:hypothetical protein
MVRKLLLIGVCCICQLILLDLFVPSHGLAANPPRRPTIGRGLGPVGLCFRTPNCTGGQEGPWPCQICKEEGGRGWVTGNPRRCVDIRPGCPR